MKATVSSCLVALVVFATPVAAREASSVPYTMLPQSDFETGCFGPCACPVLIRGPLAGTFTLVFVSDDGLNAYYQVQDARWKFGTDTGDVQVIGSGTYRIGGEVAVTQRLQLDLSVAGGEVQHFDSGDVT